MDVSRAIKDRRSIRKFKRKEIPAETLSHLLEMARTAPSGANRQPWELVVITDRKRLKDLVPICKEQGFIADCGAFVIGVDDPLQKWARVDVSIALDHISLAAVEEELGTCWIGAFDPERMSAFIQLPKGKVVTACLAIGYPDESPEARNRKRMDELVSWEMYGNK